MSWRNSVSLGDQSRRTLDRVKESPHASLAPNLDPWRTRRIGLGRGLSGSCVSWRRTNPQPQPLPSAVHHDVPWSLGQSVVIRCDEGLHALWPRYGALEMARRAEERLAPLLEELRRGPQSIQTLQIHYDAPVEFWGYYAKWLGYLKQTCLGCFSLWTTSLLAHLSDFQFSGRLRGVCEGHVLQLFDRNVPLTDQNLARTRKALLTQNLPTELGFATFERKLEGGTTEHRAWMKSLLVRVRDIEHLQGFWLFPAGQPYLELKPWLEETQG